MAIVDETNLGALALEGSIGIGAAGSVSYGSSGQVLVSGGSKTAAMQWIAGSLAAPVTFPLKNDGSVAAPSFANESGLSGLYFSSNTVLIGADQTSVVSVSSAAVSILAPTITLDPNSGATTTIRNVSNSCTVIIGGGNADNRAAIEFFGGTHATRPNQIRVYQNAVVTAESSQAGDWTLGGSSTSVHILKCVEGTAASAGTITVPLIAGFITATLNGRTVKIPFMAD